MDSTILDCFVGSGSTGLAAIAEGFIFIGIDNDENYAELSRGRIAGVAALFAVDARDPDLSKVEAEEALAEAIDEESGLNAVLSGNETEEGA